MPEEMARKIIEKDLGVSVESVFSHINLKEPVGSASISQVKKDSPHT